MAHHSYAQIEADERGLFELLIDEFPITGDKDEDLLAHLTYSDMTVGPTGLSVTPDERIAEALRSSERGAEPGRMPPALR